MIRTANSVTVSYSTRDSAVFSLAALILNYLDIKYSKGAGADGMYLCFQLEDSARFEREVTEWRETASKLVIQ